jgi:polyhydroxyalkanoate synthesis regulator phasin
MHRLWQRTGGEVDAIEDLDVTNIYLEREKGASEEQINEAIQNLSALVHAKAPQPDVLDAIESLRAVTLSDMAGLRSEVGELREQVESIFPLVAQIYKYLR